MSTSAIDEAFGTVAETLVACTDFVPRFEGTVGDEKVVVTAEELTIQTPIEMSLAVDEDGRVSLGCVPPLYDVEVTFMPVLHSLRFTAVVS